MNCAFFAGEFETADGERIEVVAPSFTRGWTWLTSTETSTTMGLLSEALWSAMRPGGLTWHGAVARAVVAGPAPAQRAE